MTETIEFKHNPNATEWALGTERVPVFTVVRDNPEHAEWAERKAQHDMQQPTEMAAPREPFAEPEPPRELSKTYDMPAKTNAGLALAYLKHARQNADMAASWLLELALGSEGYDAFTDELGRESDTEVAAATMKSVVSFVAQKALGGLGKA